jgi:hypothetical protein
VRSTCNRSVLLAMLAVSTMLLSGCAMKTINQIVADPSHYRNRDVRVSGAVVDSYSVADRGAYRIDDGTGQIWIVSDRGVPRTSARVTVTGRIREGFNTGARGDRIPFPPGTASGLVLMESSHKSRN